MPLKRFRNVKWDKKRQFKKYLQKFNLNEDAIELIDIVSNKNIIVTTFNSLLRESNIDYKKHLNEANLMKLYSSLAIIDFIDLKDKKSITNEIKKIIKKLDPKKVPKAKDVESENWEQKMIGNYKLSDQELKDFFVNHEFYKTIATLFSDPFDDQRYFNFSYLFTMYVSMETVFNKYSVSDNMDLFLIKLEVQQKMIQILSDISPKNFNAVVINMNKWFNRFDKKFFKLMSRKKAD